MCSGLGLRVSEALNLPSPDRRRYVDCRDSLRFPGSPLPTFSHLTSTERWGRAGWEVGGRWRWEVGGSISSIRFDTGVCDRLAGHV